LEDTKGAIRNRISK